jgi:hypothetical protein
MSASAQSAAQVSEHTAFDVGFNILHAGKKVPDPEVDAFFVEGSFRAHVRGFFAQPNFWHVTVCFSAPCYLDVLLTSIYP